MEKKQDIGSTILGFVVLGLLFWGVMWAVKACEPPQPSAEESRRMAEGAKLELKKLELEEKKRILDLDRQHTDEMLCHIYFRDLEPKEVPEWYQKIWSDYMDKKLPKAEQERLDMLFLDEKLQRAQPLDKEE